jgi:hypothetical protein
MANDIFGLDESTRPTIAGGFRFAGTHIMAFVSSDQQGSGATSGTAYTGFLVQTLTTSYTQQVITVKGLNNKDQYRFVMPPSGTGNINSIIGDAGDTMKFITQFANPCNFNNNLHISGPEGNCNVTATGANGSKKLQGLSNLTMTCCVVNNAQMSVQLTQLAYTAVVTLEYISLVNAAGEMQTNKPQMP